MPPTLLYLYGPPAAGKLTIASAVAAQTGIRLFHNHLTVNAVREVFDFGTEPFVTVLHRLRLDVFATAMRVGTSLIFTNNSAWGGVDGRARFAAFADEASRVVTSAGGRSCFVQVSAPRDVLEARVGASSRAAHGKLTEVARLRELLDALDPSPLHADDVVIDSSNVTAEEAAMRIVGALERLP